MDTKYANIIVLYSLSLSLSLYIYIYIFHAYKVVFDSTVKKFGKMFYTLDGVWVNMKIWLN